jgi:hypothetical protein
MRQSAGVWRLLRHVLVERARQRIAHACHEAGASICHARTAGSALASHTVRQGQPSHQQFSPALKHSTQDFSRQPVDVALNLLGTARNARGDSPIFVGYGFAAVPAKTGATPTTRVRLPA